MLKNFRTYDLAVQFYKQGKEVKLPAHLKSQFLGASSSIVLNLAEGRGKSGTKEQKRFFTIAMGSLRECQAALELEDLKNTPLWNQLDILGTHLYRLIKNA